MKQQLFSSAYLHLYRIILSAPVFHSRRAPRRRHNSAFTKQPDECSRENRVRGRKTYFPVSRMWKLFTDTVTRTKKKKC